MSTVGLAGWGLAAVLFIALVSALRMHAVRMAEQERDSEDQRQLNEAACRYLKRRIEELGG